MARDEDSDFAEEEEEYADSEVRNMFWQRLYCVITRRH